mgnify:CR=1 FL=1
MKKLYVPVLALLTLASCSKSELANRPVVENDMVEIMATSKALTIETRAPFEGSIASDNTLTAVVLGSTTSADYSTTYCDGEMTFTDDNITPVSFATSQYYPVSDATVYFCALYPTALADWKDIATTAKYTFDGKTDVMAAAEVSGKKSTAMAGTNPSFEFKHLLTKLVVKVKAENENAQNVWGDITGISLVKANNSSVFDTAEVTLATGAAATGTAFSNAAADGMAFYHIDAAATPAYTDNAVDATDNKIELTTDAVAAAYSLVAPIIAENGVKHFTLSVDTKLGETVTTKEVSFDLYKAKVGEEDPAVFSGDTQGKAFEVTLTFKATEIVATATVTDWVKGGNTEVEIQ